MKNLLRFALCAALLATPAVAGPAIQQWSPPPLQKSKNLSDVPAAATARTNLGVAIGTNVEAWSANLDTWSAKTPYAGAVTVTTGKTLTSSNTLTLTGTDGSSVALGAGGTVAYIVTGTWTPTIAGSSGGTATITNQVGSYEQIGRQWTARFLIDFTGIGTATGQMRIGGLPWTQANTSNDYGTCTFAESAGVTFPSSGTSLGAWIAPNTAVATLYASGSGSNGGTIATVTSGELIGICFGHS